ncbi:MAG TPA: hypothetical protein VFZ00_15170 [Solirubrobacter sp.]|jgi:hypothetical protein|nr:hypothetical protein [Solirubrobacter sp.]
MRTRVLLAAVAATALLAACGGEEPTAAQDREAANRKALLEFAKCMREHGIDMPDPQFEGGRITQRARAVDNPEKMREAEEACAKYREAVKPPEMSDEDKERFRKAALEHARCMREQGIDMPDPQFGADGGARIQMRRGSGIDPDDPKFRTAEEACRDKMPQPKEDEQ